MAEPKFGYTRYKTVDGTVDFIANTLIVPNGSLELSEAEAAEIIFSTEPGGGDVTSVFGRVGAVVAATNDYTWAQINKATSSLADIATRSASDLSSGTLPDARFPSTLPAISGVNLTNLNATQLTSGTIPDARFPATLPAISGINLTSLNASNLGSGTVPDARFPATLPAISGANLTSLNASNLATGTVADARLSTNVTLGGNSFTGTGAIVRQTSPSLVTPALGVATATSLTVTGNVFINAATANLFMKDTSTGWQVSATTVITPQSGNAIRSTNYTSGLIGWNISALGNAEFNNVDVRGAIRASIFTFNSISATSGTLGVFKAAGKLRTLTSTPASPSYGVTTIHVEIDDPEGLAHASAQIFQVNDILRLKDPLTGDVWLRVASVTDLTTHWRYVSTVMAGTANATFNPGLGVPNYGPANAGFIIQTADQTNAPYLQMATHAATFTSADSSGSLILTPRLRIGNLNGSYGYAADTYGFGTGTYGVASSPWLTVDATNGIRIGNNTTVNGSWATDGTIIIGPVAASLNNIRLSPTAGLQLRTNTTQMLGMGFGGDMIVGQQVAGENNVLITPGALAIRNNTTERIKLNANGSGFLANSNISWDASGNLTVAGNATIAGWSIASAKISSTGIDLHSGAAAALAFGTTPPTSASAGTGIWLDRTGLYGLASSVVQAKIDAATGKITAGAGGVILDVNGARLQTTATSSGGDPEFVATNSVKFQSGTDNYMALYSVASTNKGQNILALRTFEVSALDSRIEIDAYSPTGKVSVTAIRNFVNAVTQQAIVMNSTGVKISSNAGQPQASAALDVESTTGAFIPPRMTTTQRDALTAVDGMVLYNSTLATLQYRKAGAWVSI